MPSRICCPNLRKFEIPLLVLVLLIAAWLRFVNLAALPVGFHGDEAVSGLEGLRILRDGYIGPYSRMAMGQPSGPLYLTALSIGLFGRSIWAVRAVSAALGTLTVLLLYQLLRREQGRRVALIGSFLLATLQWHLHFSRIGFPVIAWPLCTLLAIDAALEAVRKEQARWWALCGFLTGVGIYSYNADILCVAALALWLIGYLLQRRDLSLKLRAAWLFSFLGLGASAAIPMALFALNPADRYFRHVGSVSIFSAGTTPWPQLHGFGAKALFLAVRYLSFWDNLSWHSSLDLGDGTGTVPVVPFLFLALALLGLGLGWKKRGPLMPLGLCFMLALPFGSVLTIDGLDRRSFALAPILAFLAAVGIVEIFQRSAARLQPRPRLAVAGSLALVCGAMMSWNVLTYFEKTLQAEPMAWTFAQDLTRACDYMNHLPGDAHIYFYSERWATIYETRRFLAPHLYIEDRSKEFGQFSFDVKGQSGAPVFLLMGQYENQLPRLRRLYPQAAVHSGALNRNGEPSFIAVVPG